MSSVLRSEDEERWKGWYGHSTLWNTGFKRWSSRRPCLQWLQIVNITECLTCINWCCSVTTKSGWSCSSNTKRVWTVSKKDNSKACQTPAIWSHYSPWLNGIASFVRSVGRGDKGRRALEFDFADFACCWHKDEAWCGMYEILINQFRPFSFLCLSMRMLPIKVVEMCWNILPDLLECVGYVWILPSGVAWQCSMCWGTNSCELPWFMNLVFGHTHCAYCSDQSTQVSLATTTRLDTTCRLILQSLA